MTRTFLMLAMVVMLAACGRSMPIKMPNPNGGCVGFSDNVHSLREGDELPRVVQVLGYPDKAYRGYSLFGRVYDVLEYKITPSSCYMAMLDSRKDMVKVVFDKHGEYLGTGDKVLSQAKGFWTIRQEPLVLDPAVLRP